MDRSCPVVHKSRCPQAVLQTVTLFYIHCGPVIRRVSCRWTIYYSNHAFAQTNKTYHHIKKSADCSHHAEGLVDPQKCARKKGYWFWIPQSKYLDSENIKLIIGSRAGPCFTNFFKIHKMQLNWQNFFRLFSRFSGRDSCNTLEAALERIQLKNEIFPKNRKIQFLVNFWNF
jgi:hypothetical protein